MKETYTRFLGVAIVVCLFAVAMATLLNYYKYKSTVEGIVRDRVLLIANGIDSSVQSSLALGIGFGELTMLPPLLANAKSYWSTLQPGTVSFRVFAKQMANVPKVCRVDLQMDQAKVPGKKPRAGKPAEVASQSVAGKPLGGR